MLEKAIHYELDCNKCSNIGYLIGEKQYAIDRRNKKCSEEGKKYYHQAFQLMKLIKSESEMSSLKNAYKKWYGEELI